MQCNYMCMHALSLTSYEILGHNVSLHNYRILQRSSVEIVMNCNNLSCNSSVEMCWQHDSACLRCVALSWGNLGEWFDACRLPSSCDVCRALPGGYATHPKPHGLPEIILPIGTLPIGITSSKKSTTFQSGQRTFSWQPNLQEQAYPWRSVGWKMLVVRFWRWRRRAPRPSRSFTSLARVSSRRRDRIQHWHVQTSLTTWILNLQCRPRSRSAKQHQTPAMKVSSSASSHQPWHLPAAAQQRSTPPAAMHFWHLRQRTPCHQRRMRLLIMLTVMLQTMMMMMMRMMTRWHQLYSRQQQQRARTCAAWKLLASPCKRWHTSFAGISRCWTQF